MRQAVIVSGARSPIGKSPKGALRDTRPEDLGAIVLQESWKRAGNQKKASVDSKSHEKASVDTTALDPAMIEDVMIGCAFPEGEQGLNLARNMVLRAGWPAEVPAMTVNRYCASGLQTIAMAAERIMLGQADIIVAGGVESMSRVPMGGHKIAPNPWLVDNMPQAYMSMGHTAEEVAKRCDITRAEQDEFAERSHQRAAKAVQEGKFKDEIVSIPLADGSFDRDEGVRPDTNVEVLSKLRPAFHVKGTVTAGNSSQTSDGAAAVVVMSREKADELGLQPLLIYRSFAVGGVEPDVMGIGPVVAIPRALQLAGLTIDEVGLFELNEAFAAQSIQVIRHLQLNEDKVNVNGGAIALGHPLGCTGTKLTLSLLHEMKRRNERYGVVTMCVGGGMGAAGVFERV